MQVFWHKGYEATSMEDLLTAINLNRGSLYATFGDKRELFLKAMDELLRGWRDRQSDLHSKSTRPGTSSDSPIHRRHVEFGLSDPLRRGCLITNTVMELAQHEKDIARKVAGRLQMAEEAFFKLLTRAKQEGELANDKDPRALSPVLVTMMQGTIRNDRNPARRLTR